MDLSDVQISFLQRLADARPPARKAGEVARYFSEHFGLGTHVGSQVVYAPAHYEAARQMLVARSLPVAALGVGGSRADAAQYGGMSEKSFSAAPNANSVAVKALGECRLDGHALYTPEGAYQVLTAQQALRVSCDRLMVVENLETFRNLQAYAWIDPKGLAVLAVYRGDKDLPNKDAFEVVQSRAESVWGFFDFDPAGLVMAASLPAPRLERLVLPSAAWLQEAANSPRGRQLFDAQESYASGLDACEHPQIAPHWKLMKRLRSAVTQERMLCARPELACGREPAFGQPV